MIFYAKELRQALTPDPVIVASSRSMSLPVNSKQFQALLSKVSSFDRLIATTSQDGAQQQDGAALGEWLDYCEMKRRLIIQEIRHIDQVLIRHGQIKRATLPKRIK